MPILLLPCGPVGQGVENTFVVLCFSHCSMLTFVPLACLLHRSERERQLGGGWHTSSKQIANHLVTDSSYSHPLPEPYKFDDHASPGKRLARSRWSLDRKH
jgi:hypothetical protein